MTDRHTRKDRLERAGFRHVAGWASKEDAARMLETIEYYRPDVERIAAEPQQRGRRKKETMK